MRVVPTHGTLHGGTHDNLVACPPEPFLEVDEDEGNYLIRLGVAKVYVEGQEANVAKVTVFEAGDRPVEQASVGAEGAASGEEASAAASEATSDREDGEQAERLKDVAEHIELLEPDDFVKTGDRAGKPKVAALVEATGFADLTAEEVDAAFAIHQAQKAEA
jgi:hypothetical protein